MPKRKIIRIDEKKCNGCKACIPNCFEGAIQMIAGKARLVSDLFCDGLGACLGYCPQGAITIEEREAGAYDERKVMENIVAQGEEVIKAHLAHLKDHDQSEYLKQAVAFLKKRNLKVPQDIVQQKHAAVPSGCPGARMVEFQEKKEVLKKEPLPRLESQLRQWPVQIVLVPPHAPYLEHADVLVAADCVGFAYANFHEDLLKGKVLLVGCPKLDDVELYQQKFTQMFESHDIKSVTYAHMEVPCCFGMIGVIKQAIEASGKQVAFSEAVISIRGERIT